MRPRALVPATRRLRGLLWVCALAAQAQDAEPAAFTFRGFGTLALTRNSTDQAEFVRDVSEPKGSHANVDAAVDSRLGLQFNLRLQDQWEFVAQAMSSRRYDDTFKPELNWAFLRYRPTDTLDLRVGRLGFDVYLLADSRNVDYSNLWVRPPVEFYGGVPITSFDGADLVLRGSMAGGFGSLKLYGGQATGRIPATDRQVFDLKGSPLMGANGDFRVGDWWVRLDFAQLKFKRELDDDVIGLLAGLRDPMVAALSPSAPALADELSITGKWIRYLSFSAMYETGPFKSQLGLSRIASQTPTFPRSYAGYLLLGYRWGEWTPYAQVADVNTTHETRSTGLPPVPPLDTLNTGVAILLNSNQNRQSTASLGLRWDFTRNFCLKAQMDLVRNRDHAVLLWWHAQSNWDGHATVATLALNFVF